MKEKWYENDWIISLVAVLSLAFAAVGNYYYHGGYLVW
jgi:hypothetical protein